MTVEINDIIAAAEAETHIGNRDRVIQTGTLTLREHPPVDHDAKLKAEHFARWRNAKAEMVEVKMVPARSATPAFPPPAERNPFDDAYYASIGITDDKPAVVHDSCGSVPISFAQEMEYFKTHQQLRLPTNEALRAELSGDFGVDLGTKPDQTVVMVGTLVGGGMTFSQWLYRDGPKPADLFTLRTQGIGPFMLDDDVAAIREAACPKPDPYIYIGGVALDVREWGELLCRRMIPVINKFSNKGVHLQSTPIPCVAEQFMRDLAEIVATTVVGDDGQPKHPPV